MSIESRQGYFAYFKELTRAGQMGLTIAVTNESPAGDELPRIYHAQFEAYLGQPGRAAAHLSLGNVPQNVGRPVLAMAHEEASFNLEHTDPIGAKNHARLASILRKNRVLLV